MLSTMRPTPTYPIKRVVPEDHSIWLAMPLRAIALPKGKRLHLGDDTSAFQPYRRTAYADLWLAIQMRYGLYAAGSPPTRRNNWQASLARLDFL